MSGTQLRYLKLNFQTISQEWSPYWDDVTRKTFESLPWRSRSQHDLCSKIMSGPKQCYLQPDFKTILQKWSPYWDDVSRGSFGSLPWRSRSQHDLVAYWCPAHNFIIWSRISKLLYRNNHHIEMTKFLACVQNLFGEHYPVYRLLLLLWNRRFGETTLINWCRYWLFWCQDEIIIQVSLFLYSLKIIFCTCLSMKILAWCFKKIFVLRTHSTFICRL